MSEAYIVDYCRTPIDRCGGALAAVRPDHLAACAIAALMERQPAVDPDALDEAIFGCANQAGEDNRNIARMADLLAGLPVSVPGTAVNRLCGSGIDAVAIAAGRSSWAGRISSWRGARKACPGRRRALATVCIGVGQASRSRSNALEGDRTRTGPA